MHQYSIYMEERKLAMQNREGMGLLNSSVVNEQPRSMEYIVTEDDDKFHEMVSAQVK